VGRSSSFSMESSMGWTVLISTKYNISPMSPPRELDALRNPVSGSLTEPIATAALELPTRVELIGTMLAVRLHVMPETRPVPRDLLERFLSLETPSAVRGFAERYGPLRAPTKRLRGPKLAEWLSTEGAFDFRLAPVETRDAFDRFGWIPDRRSGAGWFTWREPLDWWFLYRERFQHLLAAAIAIREDRSAFDAFASLRDLTSGEKFMLFQGIGVGGNGWQHASRSIQLREGRRTLWRAIDGIVGRCQVRPRLAWGTAVGNSMRVEFSDKVGRGRISLLGALTIQLLGAVVGTGFAVCSHCGAVFTPTRKPAAARRSYCERLECKKASHRDAKADYRRRQKAERGVGAAARTERTLGASRQ